MRRIKKKRIDKKNKIKILNFHFMRLQKNDLFFNRCELRKRRRKRIEEYRVAFEIIIMDSVEREIEKNILLRNF